MTDHVIFAYSLSGPNRSQALSGDAIAHELDGDHLAWVHLDRAHPDTRNWLQTQMSQLDPTVVEALLAEETRPRATSIGDGMLLILRGVNLNAGADPEDMVSIRIWVDEKRIISMRRRHVRAAMDIADKVQQGHGPTHSGAFIAQITEALDDRIESAMRLLDDATDALEERLVDNADRELRGPITDIRRRTIQLRRHIAPQREAVAAVRSANHNWITVDDRRGLAEAQDRLTRYVEDLDAIRERAQVVKDELANALADRLNANTYMLSVIAAIFLPLGFLTGLFGINLAGIPGADLASAFWVFSGVLVVVVVVQILLFRWLRWF